uniref:HAT C-terminal dimerisation domain-containing protein n=1 Tax=Fundulus heteroclitus TaxID=8078 RepID=A0A3Q2P448_FUNHE
MIISRCVVISVLVTKCYPASKTQRGPLPAKQQKLDFGAEAVSGEELKKLVGKYVVEEMLPLNTIDSLSFRAIINKIPTTISAELPHRTSFSSYPEKLYGEMERSLKAALKDVHFVSTTADIWSANNRSYLGLTLHWISKSTLEHNKAALACRKICGRHTYDVIGAEIENIHSSYGLLNKVVATVTNNGSNFVKGFQVYRQAEESDDDEEETGEEESTSTDDTVIFSDVSEILSAENESDGQLCPPPHHRSKCTALWTKSSRSNLASETVEEVSKRKLLVPTSTRWNSFSDAVNRIIEMPMSELNMLCTKLGVKCFKDKEYQFLHEYCIVMKPMTAALDILQGGCPYKTLLPTLRDAVKDALSRMTAIHIRFAGVLDDKYALLAAASCPKFKIRCKRISNSRVSHSSSCCEMDFFFFEVEPEDDTYSAEKEVMDLRSAYDLHILHQFSNIKNIFLKDKTPTPSSALVERLFSLGGLVLTPRRNRLSDKTFEKLLLMNLKNLNYHNFQFL